MENSIQTLSDTEAWVYNGQWVADCPRDDCNNVELANDTYNVFTCSNCGMIAFLNFPKFSQDIMQELSLRPIPQSRNWFYPDQPLAIKAGLPHGQTVNDIIQENREHGVS